MKNPAPIDSSLLSFPSSSNTSNLVNVSWQWQMLWGGDRTLLYFFRLSRKLLSINQERSPGWIEIVLVKAVRFEVLFLLSNISHLDRFWSSDWIPAAIDWFWDDDVGVRLGEEIFIGQFVSSESQGKGVATLHFVTVTGLLCSLLRLLQDWDRQCEIVKVR